MSIIEHLFFGLFFAIGFSFGIFLVFIGLLFLLASKKKSIPITYFQSRLKKCEMNQDFDEAIILKRIIDTYDSKPKEVNDYKLKTGFKIKDGGKIKITKKLVKKSEQ
jgi:hypothetical protein